MGATDVHFGRGVFFGGVVLPSCAIVAGLWWWKRSAFTLAVVFVGVVVAESLQEFVQGKRARRGQRVQAQAAVVRISRAIYSQLDTDTLRLLASARDFDERDYERLLQLDSVRDSDGGATDAEIQRFPLVAFTEQMLQASNRAGCSICLSPIAVDASVRLLQCFHHFHPDCIDPWLKSKAECPMCKFPAIG
ncbi:hypothetical protein PybrP1_004731 [[Pythium] brassicae (nom. inval.)]|nr:hypothetical protein PybrP1_004731 [[Pythium] brassicae (nom. inval.)]